MKRMVWGTVLCLSVCMGVVSGSDVRASWLQDGKGPILHQTGPLHQRSMDECSGVTTRKVVDGLGEVTVCLFMGDPLVGVVLSGSTKRLVRGHAFDSKLYLVDGVCEQRLGCTYRHELDVLVEKRGEGTAQRIRVHYNVLEAMKLIFHPSTLSFRYNYEPQSSYWQVSAANGASLDIRAYAVSDSGRWIVAELRNIGTLRIQSITKEVLRIAAPGYQYGKGMDPQQQLAISDDGTAAVVTGMNSGFSIYEIRDCGEQVERALTSQFPAAVTRCPSSDGQIGSIPPNFRYIHHPRFLANDTMVSVEREGYATEHSRVIFKKPGQENRPPVAYVSLGDSFTSGEGEKDDTWYRTVTPADESCHRSIRAYPFVYGARVHGAGVHFHVACSGARLHDIWPTGTYEGQGNRVANLSIYERPAYERESLALGGGGVVPQKQFIELYQPNEATISVGGNDVGLIAKLKACASLGVCHWADPDMRQAVASEIDRHQQSFQDVLLNLRETSPLTRGVVVGYPDPIQPDGSCDVVTSTLFSFEERTLLRNMIQRLNRVLYRAAQQTNYHYIDVFSATEGHQLCSSGTPAMNGFRFGDDAGPIASLPGTHFIGAESFHPTPLGHSLVASRMVERKNTIYEEPHVDESYWAISTVASNTVYQYTPMQLTYIHPTLSIKLPPGSLPPASGTRVSIRSELTELGIFETHHDGSLQVESFVPHELEPGYHTLEVRTRSIVQDEAVLYEVVYIPPKNQLVTTLIPPGVQVENGMTNDQAAQAGNLGVTAPQQLAETVTIAHNQTSQRAKAAVLGDASQQNILYQPLLSWILLALFGIVGIITVWYLFVRLLRN